MSPRPQIDHIRKPQLLAAAAAVIAERGMAATRIADVAERAGTSSGRRPLLVRVARRAARRGAHASPSGAFHDELAAALEPLEDPRARLVDPDRALGRTCDDWVLWMELWIAGAARPGDEARRASGSTTPGARRSPRSFAMARHRATSAAPDPERAALELASLIDGLAVQVALGDRLVTPELMRSTCIEVAERLLEAELPAPAEAAA